MPIMIRDTITATNNGTSPSWGVATLLLIFAILIILIICIQEGARKILILGARRQVAGGKVTAAPDHYMPFRINPAGVLPIIFASSFIFLFSIKHTPTFPKYIIITKITIYYFNFI